VIRVVLADDHHLVRQGIGALLERAGDIQVVGEAADGREAVELIQRVAADVLVMDIAMPRLDGIQATERVRALGVATRVVILSMHSDETLVRQALRRGARGYVLKGAVREELLLAIRAAMRGDIYLSPAISASLLDELLVDQVDGDERGPLELLTPREREVLQLIVEGHTNTAMAHELQVSVKTVQRHRANLMAKLNVHDLAGLVRMAITQSLVIVD